MAQTDPFSRRLADYKKWRDELTLTIAEYQAWIDHQGLGNGVEDLRTYELIESLKTDKLIIALVAEFSRGKTELINALFFSDYKQRLLPSEAGRTTMCPTELQYDEKVEACIKLLPIETRASSMSIAEYKQSSVHWTTLPLALSDSGKMTETFREIVQTKRVTVHQARELGLYSPGSDPHGAALHADGKVDIPVWRHAVINYPHPLLKQGLVILDTPGLNSLGTEPELTMSMLPKAHLVMFVLAADSGVTKSDLEVWNNHVRLTRGSKQTTCFALLNKIDTLWDELLDAGAITASIQRQTQDTARILGINPSLVFPVSARKGLIGKIKTDHDLIEKSGLLALEIKLSDDVVPRRQQYVRDKVIGEIGDMIQSTGAMVLGRLGAIENQISELKGLGGKSLDVIQNLIARLRKEKNAYDHTLVHFQNSRAALAREIDILMGHLSMTSVDKLIEQTRGAMQDSWTTHGLKTGMETFFNGTGMSMERVNKQAHHVKQLLEAAYCKFHTEHGLTKIRPVDFSLLAYRSEFQRLREDAEAFRNSPILLMTESHFVIKKFFITLVSRARGIFDDCNQAANTWSRSIMAPILDQLQEHKIQLTRRLDDLKKIQDNLDNLDKRIAELDVVKKNLHNQQQMAKIMLHKIHRPISTGNYRPTT
jgi:hypothetical protein